MGAKCGTETNAHEILVLMRKVGCLHSYHCYRQAGRAISYMIHIVQKREIVPYIKNREMHP